MNKFKSMLKLFTVLIVLSLCFTACGKDEKPTESKKEQPALSAYSMPTIESTMCFEYNGLTVTAAELVEDIESNIGLVLEYKNTSENDFSVCLKFAAVNNYLTKSDYSYLANSKTDGEDILYFYKDELELADISVIGRIELVFQVVNNDDDEVLFESEPVVIDTSLFKKAKLTCSSEFDEIYNKNSLRLSANYIINSNSNKENTFALCIENLGENDIMLTIDSIKINGKATAGITSETVQTGKYAIGLIDIFKLELQNNEITDVREIEFSFTAYDTITYDVIAEEDSIKFQVF